MQIKITLDPNIADALDKEAKAMGVKLPVYIKFLLGQYIAIGQVSKQEKTA